MSEQRERPPIIKFAYIRREFVEAAETLPTEGAKAATVYAMARYLIYGDLGPYHRLSKPAKMVFNAHRDHMYRIRSGSINGTRGGGNPTFKKRRADGETRDGGPDSFADF